MGEKNAMAKRSQREKPTTYSIGELAARWKVGPERVRALVESGRLPHAFEIPSSGRFGRTLRIPASDVEAAEQDWTVETNSCPLAPKKPSRRANLGGPALKHFPELLQREGGAGGAVEAVGP